MRNAEQIKRFAMNIARSQKEINATSTTFKFSNISAIYKELIPSENRLQLRQHLAVVDIRTSVYVKSQPLELSTL